MRGGRRWGSPSPGSTPCKGAFSYRTQSSRLPGSEFLSSATFGRTLRLRPHLLAPDPQLSVDSPSLRPPHRKSQSKEVGRALLHVVR